MTVGSEETSPTVNVTINNTPFYTDPDTQEQKRATGIKTNNTLLIASGTTTVSAKGPKARGVRATQLRATGGSLVVTKSGLASEGITLSAEYYPFKSEGGTVSGSFAWKD